MSPEQKIFETIFYSSIVSVGYISDNIYISILFITLGVSLFFIRILEMKILKEK